MERGLRQASLLLALVAVGCPSGPSVSGSTGDTGDAESGSTTVAELLACGDAPNSMVIDGVCFCEPGTTWADPFNPNSFDCDALQIRLWPPCYVHGEGPGCTCDPDGEAPPDVGNCEAAGTAESDNVMSGMEDGATNTKVCGLDVGFECDCEDQDEACECPQVFTCTCPEYTRWCSFDPGPNVECCYDPAQDPTGAHAPGTTTGTDDASTGADSTTTTSTDTGSDTSTGTGTGTSTGGESSSGSSSAGSTGAS